MSHDKYISILYRLYKKLKRMPSYSELLAATGLKSKNAIHRIVAKLVEHEIIKKDSKGRLLPGPQWYSVRVLGTVAAGWPSPAEEELLDTMSLEEYLIENREATFMLKVSGDSMKDAGIMPGDMVLVERRSEARNGDIVIAEVDHQWTMKYYRKTGSVVQLIPANAKFSPITPKEQLNIAAIVKAVIRKY
jgi:SOS regulatory protein LexA